MVRVGESRSHLKTSRGRVAPTCQASLKSTKSAKDQRWGLWFALPIAPFENKKTLRVEVVPRTMWTFDQVQGLLNVIVNIRMTVIALEEGGLFVYAPVAPTPECMRLLQELIDVHGPVKYIVLPTYAVEHKVYVGPFAKRCPEAEVWIAPNQWSWPLNIPIGWVGLFPRRARIIPEDSSLAPWSVEFQHAILGPIGLGLGPFVEVAFHHKKTRTLLLTDTLVSIPSEPPAICLEDPEPLLYHARDEVDESKENTSAMRLKGWRKTVLFALYIRPKPDVLELVSTRKTFEDWFAYPSFPSIDGFFPFSWRDGWKQSFDTVEGRLLVAPLLQAFILNRGPRKVQDWVNEVSSWGFQQILPCHFAGPVRAGPSEFREAFDYLLQPERQTRKGLFVDSGTKLFARARNVSIPLPGGRLPGSELQVLDNVDEFFRQGGLSAPKKTLEEDV